MRRSIFFAGLLLAGSAIAQPAVSFDPMAGLRRAVAPLGAAQRAARLGPILQPYGGKPLSAPFKVGPGLPVPSAIAFYDMIQVYTTTASATGGMTLFATTTLKSPVDIWRPMIAVRLNAHAKPYLVDCSLSVGGSDQHVAYLDADGPMYHSKIMAQKSLAAVQDGHALFAVAPAAAARTLYIAPIYLSEKGGGWSLSFTSCEFSTVG